MNNWFQNLKYKMAASMAGRYGMDRLSRVLMLAAVIISLIGSFYPSKYIYIFVYVPLIYGVTRCYSKNIPARQAELAKYMEATAGLRSSIKVIKGNAKDKQHKYVKCPQCKTVLRVPRGNGDVMVNCPNCHTKTKTRS